jgi:very-short-patch-repair endonuclease
LEETKLKRNRILKGRHFSEDHKNKISLAKKGKPPWNKGLTKETDERVARYAKPRTRKRSTEKTRQMLANTMRLKWVNKSSEEKAFMIEVLRKNNKNLSKERRLKISVGAKNFWNNLSLEERRQKIRKCLSFITNRKNVSKGQLKLYVYLKETFLSAVLNYEYSCPYNPSGLMYLDIAIPEEKVEFEYDSISYHKNRKGCNFEEKDKIRDEYLTSMGWVVIRITEKELKSLIGC